MCQLIGIESWGNITFAFGATNRRDLQGLITEYEAILLVMAIALK